MATEKRASGTTRHGGPKLQLKAVMCNPLCQRRIHRMEASIQKVIVGMAPKFICSERARKQEEFCTKLEQKHKALEEERSNFEEAALPTNTLSMPCIFIPMEGKVYLAIGCGFKFRAGESAALTGMALADHGNHGLGGRMGTRMIGPQPLIFDHAAQFFTVNDSRFHELVDGWLERGLVRPWEGVIGELEVGGQFTPFPSSPPKYIGVSGMRPLADSLLAQTSMVSIVRPCWISNLEPFNGMWHLSENVKLRGQFDVVVIAHNGKCANRLLGSSGLPQIARQMKRLELSSIWALLAAFEDPLPLGSASTFEGAFVKGVDSVSWMANNSAKLLNSQSDSPHCWTFFSTAAYGKQNKVPQENIPTATAEKVKTGMLEGVEAALGRPKGSLQKPIYSRVQLWGAALPTNTPSIPCIFDPHGRAGICGDWLLGSSVESAALSGVALANHIADYLGSDGVRPEEFAVGLHTDFQSLQGHDIGQFPGLESMEKEQVQAYQLSS